MSLIKTVRNRTKAKATAQRLAGNFAPNRPSQAATIAGRNLVTIGGRTMRAAGIDGAIGDPVAVYNDGSPGMAAYSANGAGLAIQYAGGGASAGTGGGMEAHALDGPYHTGTITDAQAPQFLKADGTRQLTGDLTVAAGIKIDGVDVGTPGAGLIVSAGAYALSPSSAGQGLSYSTGVYTVGVANTGPAGLTIEADAIRLTTSSAPGAAAAVLATDATGGLTLAGTLKLEAASVSPKLHLRAGAPVGADTYIWQNGADLQIDVESLAGAILIDTTGAASFTTKVRTPLIDAAGAMTIQATAGSITVDPQSALLPAGSYIKDLGAYNRKFRSLYVAELIAETLVAQDVMSTIGGRIMVAPTTTLIADAAAGSLTIDTKHNNLGQSAYIMLQTAPGGISQFEIMKTAGTAPTAITGGYRYTVTRAHDGSSANAWTAGDAVVTLGGAVGQGYIDLTSTSTVHSHAGPTITIYARTGTAAWTDTKAVATMGNLQSFVGYGAAEYGQAAGNDLTLTPSTGFKGYTVDRTNGLRLFSTALQLYNGATQTVQISPTGADIWIGPSTADRRLSWNGSTLAIVGAVTVSGGNANITVGSGTKDVNLAGWNIGATEIVGQAGNGADQVTLGTDGRITAGAGAVSIDRDGISINSRSGGTGSPDPQNRIDFMTAAGASTIGYIGTTEEIGNDFLTILQYTPAAGGANIRIEARTNQAWPASIEIKAYNINTGNTRALAWTETSAAPTFNGYAMYHAGNDGAFARPAASNAWTAMQKINAENTGWAADAQAAPRLALMKFSSQYPMIIAGSTSPLILAHRTDNADASAASPTIRADLTIDTSGNLTTTDADLYMYAGRAAIGHAGFSGSPTVASFTHRNRRNTTDFALAQNSDGKTVLNAASGQSINLRIAGSTDKAILYTDRLQMETGLMIKSSGSSDGSIPTPPAGYATLALIVESGGNYRFKIKWADGSVSAALASKQIV